MGRGAGLSLLVVFLAVKAMALSALVSHTEFRSETMDGKPGSAYTETYWQIIPVDLHYVAEDNKWRASIVADIVFRNDTGVVVEEHLNLRTAPAATLAAAKQQNIIDLHRYKLPEGKIKMQVKLSEPGYAGKAYIYTDSFTIEKLNGTSYSGVQLLDTSYAASQGNVFVKNGKMNVPLATNFLDDYHKVLHYYTELYQTELLPDSSYPLVQRTFISKREFEPPLNGLMQKQSITRKEILPQYGDFSVASLASGNYYLNVILEDKMGVRMTATTYFFQLENKKPVETVAQQKKDTAVEKIEVIDVAKSFVMKYTLPQLMAILKMITPIADALEMQTIRGFQKRPDDTYMRYFIYNFWTARNKTNPEAEWKRYSDRVRDVNKLFTAGALRGYETERGMTYLKYGPPDERIPVENEQGARPYELWEYKSLGKLSQEGVFLFYRPAELVNDYRLLHSTVNGDVRNMNWRSLLYTGGMSVDPNSPAEQYIRNK